MAVTAAGKNVSASGALAPLRHDVFRRIWTASLLSNLGLLIMGVGAAWAMTQMTPSADKVALVQTALMLPLALLSTVAGAVADMFDRRIVGLTALVISLAGSMCLTLFAWLGLLTPALLLVFCFMVGSGMALFGPAWQASVSEQVPPEALPSAVALNGISYNVARSVGPAIGGIIVAFAGAVTAFATNAVFYVPLLIVLYLWQRANEPSRLPPERLARAVISGVRYIINSPPIRVVLGRTLAIGIAGGSVPALMPLVARDLDFTFRFHTLRPGLRQLRVLVHARRARDRTLHFLPQVVVGAAVRDGAGIALSHRERRERGRRDTHRLACAGRARAAGRRRCRHPAHGPTCTRSHASC